MKNTRKYNFLNMNKKIIIFLNKMTTQTNIPYNKLKVSELKSLCTEKEQWGYSRKKKVN